MNKNNNAKKKLIPIIEVNNLYVSTQKRILLDKLNCTIFEEGISVIIGPNGAGKSLFLRCLHGLTLPDEGSIKFRGNALSEEVRSRQAFVFQNPVLLKRSVFSNLTFITNLRGIKDIKEINHVLSLVGLDKIKDQSAKTLSGGEKQRLSLARAILTKPDYLFLDEPTSNLDPGSTNLIENLVKKVSQEGTKVVYITHDIFQAKRISDEIIFMYKGLVLEKNTSNNFFEKQFSKEAELFIKGVILV